MVYQMVMYIFTQKHIYPEMWDKKLVHFAHMQFTYFGLLPIVPKRTSLSEINFFDKPIFR